MNPRISEFFGIKVYMYYEDHNPPHFHVKFKEYECFISIDSLKIIKGTLPKNIEKLVIAWAELYKKDLLEDWLLIKSGKEPNIINPIKTGL